MMKKILFLVLVLSVFVVANAFAAGQAYLWGGYTRVNMKNFNSFFDSVANVVAGPKAANANLSKVKDAFIIGADYLYDINGTVKIGPRVAFLLAEGKIISDVHNMSFDFSLVPIMFGGSYNKNISEKFSLNGKLFYGYGLIKHKEKEVWRDELGARREKTLLVINGGCFVSEISIGAQYWLTKRLGLGLDLGYRCTLETEIKGKKEWHKRLVDFSGLTTKLSLSYKV